MTDFPKLGYSSGTTPRAMLFVIVSAAICFLNVLTVVAQQNPGFNLPTTVQLPVFGVAAADPAEYREISRTQACGQNWCNPAYSDGRLYLRDAREMRCVELK